MLGAEFGGYAGLGLSLRQRGRNLMIGSSAGLKTCSTQNQLQCG